MFRPGNAQKLSLIAAVAAIALLAADPPHKLAEREIKALETPLPEARKMERANHATPPCHRVDMRLFVNHPDALFGQWISSARAACERNGPSMG